MGLAPSCQNSSTCAIARSCGPVRSRSRACQGERVCNERGRCLNLAGRTAGRSAMRRGRQRRSDLDVARRLAAACACVSHLWPLPMAILHVAIRHRLGLRLARGFESARPKRRRRPGSMQRWHGFSHIALKGRDLTCRVHLRPPGFCRCLDFSAQPSSSQGWDRRIPPERRRPLALLAVSPDAVSAHREMSPMDILLPMLDCPKNSVGGCLCAQALTWIPSVAHVHRISHSRLAHRPCWAA